MNRQCSRYAPRTDARPTPRKSASPVIAPSEYVAITAPESSSVLPYSVAVGITTVTLIITPVHTRHVKTSRTVGTSRSGSRASAPILGGAPGSD